MTMASHSRIHHALYNSLPDIYDQAILSADDLFGLGLIFTNHGMQNKFGVSLLHRHFDLKPDEIVVHEGLTCSPRHSADFDSDVPLGGKSFFYDGRFFQAFEYSIDSPVEISKDFGSEVGAYLAAHRLVERVAISVLDQAHDVLMEHSAWEARTMSCSPAQIDDIAPSEVIEWGFELVNGYVCPVVKRGCVRAMTSPIDSATSLVRIK